MKPPSKAVTFINLLLAATMLSFGAKEVIASHVQAPSGAQANAIGKPAKFEVAAVRLVPEKERGLTAISNPGEPEFRAHNITLEALIGYAFGIDSGRQVLNEPSWMGSEEYDVAAKIENDQKLTYEQVKPLVQALLKDRFHLACHRETKMRKGFAMVVAKNGPHLHASSGGAYHAYILPDGISAMGVSLQTLASLLARPMGDPVIDNTGIPGKFDIELKYSSINSSDSALPSLPAALQEDLGLKLVRQDVPEEVIVIDHVDRIPSEN